MATSKITVKQMEVRGGFSPDFNLADLLPNICSPWFSMGDSETLHQIGEVLDDLPAGGADKPNWNAAMKVAEIHHKYTCKGGGYGVECEKCPSGHYAPGHCAVAPVFQGRYGKWNFTAQLTATVGRKITVNIGINGAGYPQREVVIDFPTPSTNSAGVIMKILDNLGINYYADTVEDEMV